MLLVKMLLPNLANGIALVLFPLFMLIGQIFLVDYDITLKIVLAMMLAFGGVLIFLGLQSNQQGTNQGVQSG